MKLKVKYYKRKKGDKEYKQAWIGYSYRRENGTPDFKREISLAGLDEKVIQGIDLVLRNGGDMNSMGDVSFEKALNIGAPWAAYCTAEKLGIIDELKSAGLEKKYINVIVAMILDRVVNAKAHSKLGLWETLPGSALERVVTPEGMPVQLHDYYNALDEVYAKQKMVERGLFKRSESEKSSMFLYDITSSYMEGENCPLSAFGYSRDGKKGKKQIVIGLLTNAEGRPLSVEVFEGNTSDQTTVMPKIEAMRKDFGIDEMIFVGDRGMITKSRRNDLSTEEYESIKYISALPRKELFQLLEDRDHPLQPGIFDRHKLVEVKDSKSGTRYILSFNPEKEEEDRKTRNALLYKTQKKLEMIQKNVKSGRWKSEKVIAKKLYTWINRWNMERFFDYNYREGEFTFSQKKEEIKKYEALDGFYVIISDIDPDHHDTQSTYNRYKSLIQVEQAFRTMKTTEIFMRPIRHWSPTRVKGHIFICMLAYLLIWDVRNKLKDFISRKPVSGNESKNPEDACHSLRTVWETLDRDVQLGKIKIGELVTEQLCPINEKSRKILSALQAIPTPKRTKRLNLVG